MTKRIVMFFVCLGFSVSLDGMRAPEAGPAVSDSKSEAPASSDIPSDPRFATLDRLLAEFRAAAAARDAELIPTSFDRLVVEFGVVIAARDAELGRASSDAKRAAGDFSAHAAPSSFCGPATVVPDDDQEMEFEGDSDATSEEEEEEEAREIRRPACNFKLVLRTIAAMRKSADAYVLAMKHAHKHGMTSDQAKRYCDEKIDKGCKEVTTKLLKLQEPYQQSLFTCWDSAWFCLNLRMIGFSTTQAALPVVKRFRKKLDKSLDDCYASICSNELGEEMMYRIYRAGIKD